jgi:hypothetical protein
MVIHGVYIPLYGRPPVQCSENPEFHLPPNEKVQLIQDRLGERVVRGADEDAASTLLEVLSALSLRVNIKGTTENHDLPVEWLFLPRSAGGCGIYPGGVVRQDGLLGWLWTSYARLHAERKYSPKSWKVFSKWRWNEVSEDRLKVLIKNYNGMLTHARQALDYQRLTTANQANDWLRSRGHPTPGRLSYALYMDRTFQSSLKMFNMRSEVLSHSRRKLKQELNNVRDLQDEEFECMPGARWTKYCTIEFLDPLEPLWPDGTYPFVACAKTRFRKLLMQLGFTSILPRFFDAAKAIKKAADDFTPPDVRAETLLTILMRGQRGKNVQFLRAFLVAVGFPGDAAGIAAEKIARAELTNVSTDVLNSFTTGDSMGSFLDWSPTMINEVVSIEGPLKFEDAELVEYLRFNAFIVAIFADRMNGARRIKLTINVDQRLKLKQLLRSGRLY